MPKQKTKPTAARYLEVIPGASEMTHVDDWEQRVKTLKADVPPELWGDPQTMFEAMAAGLETRVERTKKIQRGLKRGWGLDTLNSRTDAELDRMTQKRPAGRHPGEPIDGPRLRADRKQLGLTQEQFAEECGKAASDASAMSVSTIQRAESGRAIKPSTRAIIDATISRLKRKRQAESKSR